MTDHEKKVTEMIKAKIMEKDPTAEVILFGSHARGDATKDSDWDILILVNTPNFDRSMEDIYRDPIYKIELAIKEVISMILISKNDWEKREAGGPFYSNVQREGVQL